MASIFSPGIVEPQTQLTVYVLNQSNVANFYSLKYDINICVVILQPGCFRAETLVLFCICRKATCVLRGGVCSCCRNRASFRTPKDLVLNFISTDVLGIMPRLGHGHLIMVTSVVWRVAVTGLPIIAALSQLYSQYVECAPRVSTGASSFE